MDSSNLLRLGSLFHLGYHGGVGFTDRLNHQFTSAVMMVVISIVSARQYIGKPIQCWVPQEFTHAWEDYTENMCWVQSTYFLPTSDVVPISDIETYSKQHVSYYQWVAIFLALQAVLSYLPYMFWEIGSHRFPLLLRSAREAALPDKELRKKAVSVLTAALEEQAEFSARFKSSTSILNKIFSIIGPNSRNTTIFLVSRVLSIGNSVGQIYLMQAYLGYKHPFFGIHILKSVTSGQDWKLSGYFPRVTYCRILIRRWGVKTEVSYTVQCVLSLNYFLEKIYVFLWFWFFGLACLTIVNTLLWIFNVCVSFRRTQFIIHYLRALKQVSSTEEKDCDKFVRTFLGPDGVLLLRAVSSAASDLIALDVSAKLWAKFKHSRVTGADDSLSKFLENLHKSTGVAVV